MSGQGVRALLGMALGGAWGVGVSQWVRAAYYDEPVTGWVVLTFVSLALFAGLLGWIRWGHR